MLAAGVECSEKIAMTPLPACRSTTGLLPERDQARSIFVMRAAMHIFRSRAFFLHGGVIEAAMAQGMVNARNFHLRSEPDTAGLCSQRADNELWFY